MKFIKIFIVCSLSIPFLHSCQKSLDYNEATFYAEEALLNNPSLYKGLLTTIYSYLPTDFNGIDGAMRASASDDAVHVWNLSAIKRFNDGSWSPLQPLDDQWGYLYNGIRSSNVFLQKAALQSFEELRYNDGYQEMIKQYDNYPHEARFLRAFFYFELIKRYGDVPLITKPLSIQEANNVTRAPYHEIVDFIVSECDAIIPKLPLTYADLPNSETGRATRGAALALKARTLLYAASPLHNKTNELQKWISAATAAKDLMNLQRYSLDASYKNVVNNINSTELILETRQDFSNSFEVFNSPVGFQGGRTGTCPTQNLVDAYEMKETGMNINDPESGFLAEDPYVGRDPRFYETILYNGSKWKNTELEIWRGGINGPPQELATKTGYYLKKYLIEGISLNPVNPTSQRHTWAVFRFAEVLLNYAEAMNEVYGPDAVGQGDLNMTARQSVNLVRARASMPGFPENLTQAEFREKLRNERRVELAFEDNRFWDIRRWTIGNSTINIYGVDVNRGNGTFSYSRKLVEKRVWEDKMYFYPISQREIYINKSLTQNLDW
ncbi:RagB/SusD family nutrient uptake outer membrane protein [Sphingobacterium sp. HJSM2_6]|uniref:RagB/SusD family nutrient uptake outer membrane protein n=1 Tax=Sphingobacterium sp. HJSM2_6 TaxID=3366264 RepID=UPI003BDA448A